MNSKRLILLCGLCVAMIAAYTAHVERESAAKRMMASNNIANLYKDRFKFRIKHSRSIWQHEINTMLCEQEDNSNEPMMLQEPQG